MWWIATGLVAAVLALPFALRLLRRRAERVRLDRIKTAVGCSLSALKQPDGSPGTGVVDPPTSDSVSPARSAVRPRRTLMFGALYPNISVGPSWRLR